MNMCCSSKIIVRWYVLFRITEAFCNLTHHWFGLGATLYKDGTCSAEVHIRIASARAALARLNRIWCCNTISFANKFKLYKSLVTSSSSTAVKHGLCLLTLKKKNPGFWNQVLEETSLHLLLGAQGQQPGAEQDQLPCWSTETSSGNCQEMETCMVWACLMPWQPLQNYSSGHLGGQTMLWLGEEMLDGQHQRVDISAHARTASTQGPPAEKTGRGSLLNHPSCPPRWPNWSNDWTELNWTWFARKGQLYHSWSWMQGNLCAMFTRKSKSCKL